MPNLTLPVSRGVLDGQDASLIDFTQGELQTGEGVVYEPGDPAAHKISGRTKFNATQASSGKPVKALKFVQFDSADNKIAALVDTVLYTSTVGDTGSFASVHTGISSSATTLDMAKFFDNAVFCDGNSTPWVLKNDGTTLRLGMEPGTTTMDVAVSGAGSNTGDYQYWYVEVNGGEEYSDFDSGVRGAFNGTVSKITLASEWAAVTPPTVAQKVNPSGTVVSVYRSKAGGAFPIGWLVINTAWGSSGIVDDKTDEVLVTGTPYNTITVNGASESQDREPQTFSSVATYKGSLVGVKGRAYYWTPAGLMHAWPVSYVNYLRPLYGGQARCVREVNRVALVFFDNDTFRLNYLPNSADSHFDPSVAQERISTHGTPSSNGAVVFSPDGYPDMLFFASRAGPMVTDGNATARAVRSIAWDTHVSLANLNQCVCVNNTDKYRVEMYYPTSDTTIWRCLHFYYDDMRLRQGRLPKLSWTGPHIVPGPGTYAVKSGVGRVYTGNKNAESTVYLETGVSDVANLVDTNGTVNFKLRTGKMYTAGIGSEATLRRTYISKRTAGSGTYSTTHTAYREEAGSTQNTLLISATNAGLSSLEFNASGQAHDLLVERNDATAMPAINNLTAEITDISGFEKTSK